MGGDGVEHWEYLKPDGLRFVWDDTLFRPGTDSFLLSSLPKLSAGLRVCDLGCGTGLVGLLLLQKQSELTVTGIDIQPAAVALAERAAAENRLTDRLTFRCIDLRHVRQHYSTGFFDYLDAGAVLAVEWSENIEGALPADAIRLRLSAPTDDTRLIERE